MPTIRTIASSCNVGVDAAIQAVGSLEDSRLSALKADTPITKILDYLIIDRAVNQLSSAYKSSIGTRFSGESRVIEEKSKKNSAESCEELLRNKIVILTYSALRKPGAAALLSTYRTLRKSGKTSAKIVAVSSAIAKIQSLSGTSGTSSNIFNLLSLLQETGELTVLKNDRLSDECFSIAEFIQGLDNGMSVAVIGINKALSTFLGSKALSASAGSLQIIERDILDNGCAASKSDVNSLFGAPLQGKGVAPFDYSAKLTLYGELPGKNSRVFTVKCNPVSGTNVNVYFTLGDKLNSGGEAIIYSIAENPDKCVKILKADLLTEMKIRKINIMCGLFQSLSEANPALMERIAWPEDVVYNSCREPVGYIMKYFNGTHSLIEYTRDAFKTLYPGLQKQTR